MTLLDRLGLGQKRARPVGKKLEKGRDTRKVERRTGILKRASIFAVLVAITLAAFPRGDTFQYGVQVGDEWRQETLEAPFDFPIYKAEDVLRQEREAVRYNTPPIFEEIPNARERMLANQDTINSQFDRIFDAYSSYQFNRARGRIIDATEDSLRYIELRRAARAKLTPDQWQRLVSYYRQGLPGQAPSRTVETPLDEELIRRASEIATQMLNIGVMDVPLDSIFTDEIVVRGQQDRTTEQVKNKDNLFGLNEAYSFAQEEFANVYSGDREAANIGVAIFRSLFTPSLRYLRGETMRQWQEQERRISPSFGRVNRGDVIITKGERVTAETRQILVSLERERRERMGQTILWRVTLGQLLLILSTYLIFFLYLYFLRRSVYDEMRKLLLISLLFAGVVVLFAIAVRQPSVAMLGVPVAIAPILLTVLFDSRIGIFGAMTLALIGGLMLNYNFEFTFATLFASTLGVFSVRDIKNRGQFFLGPALTLVGYVIVIGSSGLIYDTPQSVFLSDLMLVGLNALLVTLAYPLVWVFERAFKMTTDLTLLELSDTNRPLLKELSLRAPGSFNHTLQVANLAEAAADAIGSNALLTRVGALYHDVGKMLKAEYFVENQRPGNNPHDQLKPRMSALIIASHVKEGLEMGRQHNLPDTVLDFVPMHHGTTRIEYFYRKAAEQHTEGEPPVMESEFRYPGPRPNSKETGILMLADSVEAASRSLDDPTHKRLETLIEMIFQTRIADGQLDDTDLTFRDLDIIKDTFLSMLLGIYHVRVKYPQAEEQKSAKTQPAAEKGVAAVPALKEEGVVGSTDQAVSIEQAENSVSGAEEQMASAPAGRAVLSPEDIAEVRSALKEERRAAGDGDGNGAQASPDVSESDSEQTSR